MSRISIIQLYLCRAAEDLVSSADARADLVVLGFGVAVAVEFGLCEEYFRIVHPGENRDTYQGGHKRSAEPYSITLTFVRDDINLDTRRLKGTGKSYE